MLFRSLAILCATLVATSSAALADINMKIKDATLQTTYRFSGADLRVDKVETVVKGDSRPIAVKSGINEREDGYIMVTLSMQNPSASEDLCVPGPVLGFELKDGSQIDETNPPFAYVSPSLGEVPGNLHPKQRINLVYLFDRWSGQIPTKMFLKNNGGCEGNNRGLGYLRFQLPPSAVTALEPKA